MKLFQVFFLFACIAQAQVHVGASRLGDKQVKAQIDGAVGTVSLWAADICNDTALPVRVDKGRVRNLMRDNGVPVIADSEGVTTTTQSEKTGIGQIFLRAMGYGTSGCIGIAAALGQPWVIAGCAGYKIFEGNLEASARARIPDSAANLARYSATPHLDLEPGACGEMVVFAAPEKGPAVYPPAALPWVGVTPEPSKPENFLRVPPPMTAPQQQPTGQPCIAWDADGSCKQWFEPTTANAMLNDSRCFMNAAECEQQAALSLIQLAEAR